MFLVVESRSTGGHIRGETTYVYRFDDSAKLKEFLIGRDTKGFEIFQAEKMKFSVELKLEKEEVYDEFRG